MIKKVMNVYKKVHSFLFGQEIEHIHTKEELKKYYGRLNTNNEVEARIVHQYPKQGKFRFPVIKDEIVSSREAVQVAPKERSVSRSSYQKEKRVVNIHEEKQLPSTKKVVKKKFQGVNFRARNIPSPVYAFGERSILKQEEVKTDRHIRHDEEQHAPKNKVGILNNEMAATTEMIQSELLSSSDQTLVEDVVITKEVNNDLQNPIEAQTETNYEQDINLVEIGDVIPQLNQENRQMEDIVEKTTELEIDDEQKFKVVEQLEKPVTDGSSEVNIAELTEEQVTNTSYVQTKVEKAQLNQEKNEMANRKTVVPFNVLMLQKDRIALQKKEEQKSSYAFPGVHLLNSPPPKKIGNDQWVEKKKEMLEQTLLNFNVMAKVTGITKGPSVTRFEIQPEAGVKVSKITSLADDIKLSLAASDIRIEAPIPGKNAIGIEVPNDISDPVLIREIVSSQQFLSNTSPLTVAMGLDIEGKPIVTDIQKMPHGLIAGATGSGKSVCINSILISILFKATPEEVRLLLIDPKMVELAPYNDIPHLVTPVITDAKQATIALKWAVEEMERRYELFVQSGVRDIKRYNEVNKNAEMTTTMPYIVIIIDELADLMMVSPQEVEESICRIAQKARACGIHLLVATQRPSVDVITGLIKANIPTRIAFSVSSQADSRTIIDSGGAEKLLGKGDMLLFENGASKALRIQGNFVTDQEIDRVVDIVKKDRKPNYLFEKEQLVKSYEAMDQEDDLFEEACLFILEQGGASSSSLQRRFRIGFNRAARLIEMMEARGIVSEAMGSKPRNVLVTEEELFDRL